MRLTPCASAAGTARARNVLTGVARAPARDGPVSSKRGLGRTPKRAARICPRAARRRRLGEGGPAIPKKLQLPALSCPASTNPGKEARAGPTERCPDPDDWDAGQARGLERQPPGASLPKANIALAPGGAELSPMAVGSELRAAPDLRRAAR